MSRSFRLDGRTLLIAGLAAALVLALGGRAFEPHAALAQVPDSGAQRVEMIAQLRQLNEQVKALTAVVKEIREQTKPAKEPERKP